MAGPSARTRPPCGVPDLQLGVSLLCGGARAGSGSAPAQWPAATKDKGFTGEGVIDALSMQAAVIAATSLLAFLLWFVQNLVDDCSDFAYMFDFSGRSWRTIPFEVFFRADVLDIDASVSMLPPQFLSPLRPRNSSRWKLRSSSAGCMQTATDS